MGLEVWEEASLWKKVLCVNYGVSSDVLRWDWNCGVNSSTFIKVVGSLYEQGTRSTKILEEGINVVVGKEEERGWAHSANGNFSVKLFVNYFQTKNAGKEGWNGLCFKKNLKRVWSSLFFAIVWTIWESRNNKVFKYMEAVSCHAQDMVRFRVAWWFKYLGGGSTDPIMHMLLNIQESCLIAGKRKLAGNEEWSPPHIDSFKFNVDGSAKGSPGLAGIGGVLRNHRENIICTFSDNIGSQDAFTAEVLAIARTCRICGSRPELVGKTIVVVNDCNMAVSMIYKDGPGSLKHAQTIGDIRNLSVCLVLFM
ncbi:hypothetical protein Ddye_011312 [Dipteronia dyeriana]|uniref:RNase H type-1 domain-containing protein n=1 Tax=Dipteronia dyeriana TaxID=168575 RepID=A0AAD9X2A9_9ROSI|nr:hypothetical protein Ddye_011312 [Dipteronia dyeriana]